MKKILLLTITCLICSCEFNKTDIGTYPEINSIFNQEEIKDLRKILTFFNDAICKSENVQNQAVEVCYQEFFKRMKMDYMHKLGTIDSQISQEEQDKLLEKISPATFEQIWSFSTSSGREHSVGSPNLFCCQNKYFNFLKAYGTTNVKIKEYHEFLMYTGHLSPGMVADVWINYKDYDVTDERIKLIIAIHYLTENENLRAIRTLRLLEHPKTPCISLYLPLFIEEV